MSFFEGPDNKFFSLFHNHYKQIIAILIIVVFLFWAWQGFRKKEVSSPIGLEKEVVGEENKFSCEKVSTDDFGFGVKTDSTKAKIVVAELDAATRELSAKLQSYEATGDEHGLRDLKELLERRKNLLVEAIYRDPDKAIYSALLRKDRKSLENIYQNCVESEENFEGTLDVFHLDFEDGSGQFQYSILKDDNSAVYLHPLSGLKDSVESGTKIRVRGLLIDNEFIFNGKNELSAKDDFTGGIEIIAQPGNPPVLGEQKVLVILANFKNTAQPAVTKEEVNEIIFNQVQKFYREVSYNKISLSGKIIGWYTLPIDQTCSPFQAWNRAISSADKDVNYNEYGRVLVIAPLGPACGWGGFATNGKTRMNTEDGAVSLSVAAIRTNYVNLQTIGHELGHNFGNHHAAFYNCPKSSFSKSVCQSEEYGDRYDIMGKNNNGHFNALHKEHVGWLDSLNIKTVTEDASYILEPLETIGSGLKAIKIPRGINDYLFVEYRNLIGFDKALGENSDVFKGALLHIREPGEAPNRSALIDPTPPGDQNSAVLLPGFTFKDPASGGSVTVVSANASGLVIKVKAGRTDFLPPDVTITYPSEQPTVSGDIKVTATVSHTSAVDRIEFYYVKQGVEKSFGTDKLAPYEALLDTGILPLGINYVQARAFDLFGNEGVSNIAGFFVVKADRENPKVSLILPEEGVTLVNPVRFKAEAADDTGIDYVRFRIDPGSFQELTFVDRTSPYEAIAYTVAGGLHSVLAEAYDLAGKSSRTQTQSFSVAIPAPEERVEIRTEPIIARPEVRVSKPKRESVPLTPQIGVVLTEGVTGVFYTATLKTSATNLVTPLNWNVPFGYGNFPPGLTLEQESGFVSGVPTKAGIWNFKAKITDANGKIGFQDFSVEIKPAVTIKTEDLPNGILETPYRFSFTASGVGKTPYSWNIPLELGELPPGLSLDQSTGVISGIPAKSGVWSFTLKLIDASGSSDAEDFVIEIEPVLSITTEKLATGTVGFYYYANFSAKVKNPPVTWSIPFGYGELPTGLSLDQLSGFISGTPSKEGVFGFTVKLVDVNEKAATKDLKIEIKKSSTRSSSTAVSQSTPGVLSPPGIPPPSPLPPPPPPPSIDTESLAVATSGVPYKALLLASRGTPPYTWSIVSGSLPDGLTLNSSAGLIEGTPTISQDSYSYFVLKVIDANSLSWTRPLYLNVRVPPYLTLTFPNGGEKLMINSPYEIKWNYYQVYSPITIQIKNTETGEIIFEKKESYNYGSFRWTPGGINTVGGVKVVISSPDLKLTDESDSSFSIEVPPGSMTIKGRFLNRFTSQPLEGVELSGPNSANQYTTLAKTNKNGEFAFITAIPDSTSNFYRSFSYKYSCYGNGSFAMQRANDGSLSITAYPFDPASYVSQKLPITGSETDLGDILFWKQVGFIITSDVPVKFMTDYGGQRGGTGTNDYKTVHNNSTWEIIPLNYDFRIKLTDASGNIYYSPFVKLSPEHDCSPVTLDFSGGQFKWGPEQSILPPSIITSTFPSGSIGTGISYSVNLTASGGVTPYSWSVSSGNLPDGLTLDLSSGMISGLPSASGIYNFTAKVTDARGIVSEKPLKIEIKSPGVSSLSAPSSTAARWSLGYRNNTVSRSIIFQYPSANISNTSALRLYEKKPGESAYRFSAEFTGISSVTCSSYTAGVGEWVLKREWKYSEGQNVCGLDEKWAIYQKGPQGNYPQGLPYSQFSNGEYIYYVVAQDSNGDVSPKSPEARQSFLEPLTILSPAESQSPISGTTTFQWTVASGWPAGVSPYYVELYDGSTYVWARYGVGVSGSRIYDGPALDPAKKYTVYINGRYTAPDKTDYISVNIATTTFWIAGPTGFYDGASRVYASVLESIKMLFFELVLNPSGSD